MRELRIPKCGNFGFQSAGTSDSNELELRFPKCGNFGFYTAKLTISTHFPECRNLEFRIPECRNFGFQLIGTWVSKMSELRIPTHWKALQMHCLESLGLGKLESSGLRKCTAWKVQCSANWKGLSKCTSWKDQGSANWKVPSSANALRGKFRAP